MRAKFIKEGIGDKYLYNKYGIKDDDIEFQKKYNIEYARKSLIPIGSFQSIYDKSQVQVYKNPSTLKHFNGWVRGCSDKYGDIYIADNEDILHYNLVLYLISKFGMRDDFIDWQQYYDTNQFYLAEGYDLSNKGLEGELTDEQKETINNYAPRVIAKHPNFKFITDKTILLADDDLKENYMSQDQDPRNFAAWVSPSNEINSIKFAKHTQFIVSQYPNIQNDPSRVYDQAFLDGWVRVYTAHSSDRDHNELSLNGKKKRTHSVFNQLYKQLSIANNYTIYFEYTDTGKDTYETFSTYDSIGKFKFKEFISNIIKKS